MNGACTGVPNRQIFTLPLHSRLLSQIYDGETVITVVIDSTFTHFGYVFKCRSMVLLESIRLMFVYKE